MGYEIIGTDLDTTSGFPISSAGDVDGDGQADLLIGAAFADSSEGTVYLINADALAALDAADGTSEGAINLSFVASSTGSYAFVAGSAGFQSAFSVTSAGDVDGDGLSDILIGSGEGISILINADDLDAIDAADGMTDGVIDLGLAAGVGSSFEFVDVSAVFAAGRSVSAAGDVDNDGKSDLLIGAPFAEFNSGVSYLINADDLAALDAADGSSDGTIELASVAGTGTSYAFVGDDFGDGSGVSVQSAGDVDNDGEDDFLIGAPGSSLTNGTAYLINADDLAALDGADGTTDGVVDLGLVGGTGTSYEFNGIAQDTQFGYSVTSAGDVDGDGQDDLLIGSPWTTATPAGTDAGSAYLINADDLAALDGADGTVDGVIDVSFVAATGTSYLFVGAGANDQAGWAVSSAGDVDDDGKGDFLIGAFNADGVAAGAGAAYLVNASDLVALDAADGTIDGIIDLSLVAGVGSSYALLGRDGSDEAGGAVSLAGDVDGDGRDDLLVGARLSKGLGNASNGVGSTYLLEADQLAYYDGLDGTVDGEIDLGNVACFLTGTRIETPDGAVCVEALQPGDFVLTADGRCAPVRFNFRQTVSTRFGPAERLMPVRIAAGALGEALPHRDLTLTAEHALFLDGLLINAGALVNGTTITRVPLAEFGTGYTVYHIETDAHDLILAEGTPAESFIDYAARKSFDSYVDYIALYGDEPPLREQDRPRITASAQVPEDLRRRLQGARVA